MLALVTQTVTGEVAVADISSGVVVDVDPSVPGYSFLRVGASPVSVVSSPDGEASFVGVAELAREGIYAIPSSCAGPPRDGETRRDLTTWPACALPSAPSEMAIVIDPPMADGTVRQSCDGTPADASPPIAANRSECAADLTRDARLIGRRKLVVTLPDLGQLAVIDAQELLDRSPGSFEPCRIEALHSLRVDLPERIEQPVPADLQVDGCQGPTRAYDAPSGPFSPRPAGIAQSGSRLYVADQGAPVVHVVGFADPCAPVEEPPLLPVSFADPARVVTTNRVAVSPVTTAGRQFVYAIDELDRPAASAMVFDVSPGSGARTPLVREGSARMPFELPDRIGFAAAIQDIGFGFRDVPIPDPTTGAAVFGTLCDPDPEITDPALPAVRHRTSPNRSQGARPYNLRGHYGFALLTNGQIAVLDVEDFDAACRRPIATNPSDIPDFRGCANDPERPPFYTLDKTETGVPTVSNEASCRIVEPHRPRARDFSVSSPDMGVRAPSLRGFPTLNSTEGGLSTDQSEPGRQQPKLLAVDFPNPVASGAPLPARVHVGTTLYVADEAAQNRLVTDPARAERASIALPLYTPRSYPADEQTSLTYEGVLLRRNNSGTLEMGSGTLDLLTDSSALFCQAGVQDVALTRELGSEKFGLSGAALEAFARHHADYVQITSGLVAPEDEYWAGVGATCGGGLGYEACEQFFADEEDPARDLLILGAYQDRVSLESRVGVSHELLECCFPSALSYVVRGGRQWVLSGSASGFRHDIAAEQRVGPDGSVSYACVRRCDPRRRFFTSRAFEVSSTSCPASPADALSACSVGPATADDQVCAYDHTTGGVVPGGPASGCIFENLTSRFVVYRGQRASQRDMSFVWQTIGGFRPLVASLVDQTVSVLPQELVFVPELSRIAVVDGASMGLSFVSLDTLALTSPYYY
jgi:hypothetical protein